MARKRTREEDEPNDIYNRFPDFKIDQLRAKAPKLMTGSCVEHPVSKNHYIMFTPDPDTIKSEEVVQKYTLYTTTNESEQMQQFNSVKPGVYNYILFANQDNREFTLHLMRMNPMEYYSKHIQILFDAKHIEANAFVYSGEMKFDGSRNILASDMSSLYFNNLKSDSIVFAMKHLFPNLEEHMDTRGKERYQYLLDLFAKGLPHDEAIQSMKQQMEALPKAEKSMYMDFYNKEGYLLKGKRETVDETLKELFINYLQLAISGILGPVRIIYNKEIFSVSDQRFLTPEFMNALCRVKKADSYPALFSDQNCTRPTGDTWCSYVTY